MKTLLQITFAFVVLFGNVNAAFAADLANVCGDSLDATTAFITVRKFDAESSITVGLLEYRNCDGFWQQEMIAIDGEYHGGNVDLYWLPGQYGNARGQFFGGNKYYPDQEGKLYNFWYIETSEYTSVTLSDGKYVLELPGRGELQVYAAMFPDGSMIEISIDPTSLVLLQAGKAEVLQDYNIIRQSFDGTTRYYPYKESDLGTHINTTMLYLPLIVR